MDYKKAYEDALERAKGIYNDNPSFTTEKFVCGQIFPEIKESEDERIRECLVTIVKVNKRSSFGLECNHGATWDEMLAYLEKQKDFKYSEEQMEDIRQYAYNKGIVDTEERQKEKQPAEWSEEDTCILEDAVTAVDLLGNDDEYSKTHPNLAKAFRVAKDWLKSLPERFNLQPKQEWNEEDKKRVVELKTFIAQCNGFNKANRQKAFEMIDALYPQPTQEWSEEDEKWFKEIELMALYFSNDTNYRERFFNWLKSVKGFKSLCPKPHTVSIKDAAKFGDLEYERGVKDGIQSEKSCHWKPCEEHIRVLLKANPVNLMPQELDVYNSLCKEIQKLM